MKILNSYKLFIFCFIAAVVTSCSDITELNENPNSPSKVPASSLVTSAQYELFNRMTDTRLNAEWGMLMTQQWAQNEYAEESRYVVNETTFNPSWLGFYTDVLNDLKFAKNILLAEEVPASELAAKNNKIAIIDVLASQAYAVLTDSFGDIPYSDALKDGVLLPKYDKQKDVYTGILETLEKAYDAMDDTSGSFATGDLIYNGDVKLWKKFTKSLMLKYAMRVSRDKALATKYATMAADDLFTSNDDNAKFSFGSESARSNPLWRNVVERNRDDYCVSKLLVETLKGKGDPRLEKFAKNVSKDIPEIIGMPYGLTDNEATTLKKKTSRPNDNVRAAQTPFYILTYSEVEFFLAEAYQEGIITGGDAATAFRKAIIASVEQWGLKNDKAVDYADTRIYDSNNWKKSIGEEKWTALYMNGLESWSEWRRLDFPELSAPAAAVIKEIPKKLPYPLSEQTNNGKNLSDVTSEPFSLTKKVWWDAN